MLRNAKSSFCRTWKGFDSWKNSHSKANSLWCFWGRHSYGPPPENIPRLNVHVYFVSCFWCFPGISLDFYIFSFGTCLTKTIFNLTLFCISLFMNTLFQRKMILLFILFDWQSSRMSWKFSFFCNYWHLENMCAFCWEPVFPCRINRFWRKIREKPFTLPDIESRIKSRTTSNPGQLHAFPAWQGQPRVSYFGSLGD